MSFKNFHSTLFYLLLFLLPTQLGYHMWPEWSMVLGRRIDFLSPTLFLTDIILALLFVLWFVETKLSVLRMAFAKWIPVILIGLFAGINIYFSHSPLLAFYSWVKFLECALLVWYVATAKPSLRLVLMSLSGAILYSSLIAIGQFILQHSIGGPFWFLGERTFTIDTPGIARIVMGGREFLRAYATFPHPNVLGGFLAVTLPFVVTQLTNLPINKLTRPKTIFYSLTLMAGAIALFFTFSRSAWIAAALTIAYAAARNRIYARLAARQDLRFKNKKLFLMGVTGIVVGLALLVFFVNPLLPTDESVVVRNQLNMSAVSIIEKSPLLGVGLGNFLVALPEALPSRTVYFLQPVHNIYLLLLSEIGIVGVGMMGWIMYNLFRGKFSYSPIYISLTGLLLLGLVDHYPLTLQQGRLLFALLIGLCLSSNPKS